MKYIDNKLNANIVKLEDTNNNYESENVEGALEEIDSKIKTVEANAYDDTQIKQEINNIKTEIGSEELTTTDQTIKGAVNEINSQIKEKVTKGESGVITNAMLSQEVKESMTGGSVAVVGKDSILEENIVDGQVSRVKTNYYTMDSTNLIVKHGYTLVQGRYYSPSAGYIEREGYSCFYMIPISPNTTYYALASDIVLFDSSQTKTRVVSGTLFNVKDFTTTSEECFVTLNFSDTPQYIVPGTEDGYVLSQVNGTQTTTICDEELSLVDANFKQYKYSYSKLVNQVDELKNQWKNLPCKLIKDYKAMYDFKDVTGSNVSITKSSKTNLADESILVVATNNGTCSITKTLDEPIPISEFESISTSIFVPWETYDTASVTGGYIKMHFNGNQNFGTYFNGRVTPGWNVLKIDKDNLNFNATMDTTINSITYVIWPRNNVPQGAEFGLFYFDSIVINLRMKPIVLISFDQIWQESIDNGAFNLMYNKRLPYTMYTIYDDLTQNQIDVINKHKNICEFSLYGSITGYNNILSDASSVSDKIDKLTQGINYCENVVGQEVETYAVSQTNITAKGNCALNRTNIKLARLIQDTLPVGYFDSSINNLCVSTSIDQKSYDYTKAIIDRAVRYGSVASLFLHGVRDDGNEATTISAKGMDLTEFTNIINYIEELRDEGIIEVMTYKEFVNKCLGK